jgi:hypothetical protein
MFASNTTPDSTQSLSLSAINNLVNTATTRTRRFVTVPSTSLRSWNSSGLSKTEELYEQKQTSWLSVRRRTLPTERPSRSAKLVPTWVEGVAWSVQAFYGNTTLPHSVALCKKRWNCPSAWLSTSHEDVWGSGCRDLWFLDLRTSWRWVASFRPLPLYSRYPLDRRTGCAPEPVLML